MEGKNIPLTSSRRWELMYLLASGLFVAYSLRVNISVAINRMADEFDWTNTEKGLLLSSFYWGYTAGQLPVSVICQVYGAKWVYGLSIFLPSLLTLFTPASCYASFGMALFTRVVIGLCASGTFPATYNFFRNWIPNDERTIMIPVVFSGIYLGEIISFPICGVLTSSRIPGLGGWESCYYLFGFIGILWFPFWARNAFEHPEQHPNISDAELKHIKKGKHPVTIAELNKRAPGEHHIPTAKGDVASVGGVKTTDDSSLKTADTTAETSLRSELQQPTTTDVENGFVHSVSIDHAALLNVENMGKHNAHHNHLTINKDFKSNITFEDDRSVSFLSDDEHALEIAERTPWLAFFKSAAVAALFINSFMADWTSTLILSELPSFLTDQLGFSDGTAGILSMPPYVANFVSVLMFGYGFDYLQQKYHWHTRTVRLLSQMVSLGGSSLCLVIVGFTTDNVSLSYTFLIIAQFLYGAEACGVNCGYQDVSPNFSFSLNTLGNIAGSIAGFLAPIAVAIFTSQYSNAWGWRASFLFTAALCMIAVLVWYCFAEAHVIHELNTPTTHRLCGFVEDTMEEISVKARSVMGTPRSPTVSPPTPRSPPRRSNNSTPRKVVKKATVSTTNPMLNEALL